MDIYTLPEILKAIDLYDEERSGLELAKATLLRSLTAAFMAFHGNRTGGKGRSKQPFKPDDFIDG